MKPLLTKAGEMLFKDVDAVWIDPSPDLLLQWMEKGRPTVLLTVTSSEDIKVYNDRTHNRHIIVQELDKCQLIIAQMVSSSPQDYMCAGTTSDGRTAIFMLLPVSFPSKGALYIMNTLNLLELLERLVQHYG